MPLQAFHRCELIASQASWASERRQCIHFTTGEKRIHLVHGLFPEPHQETKSRTTGRNGRTDADPLPFAPLPSEPTPAGESHLSPPGSVPGFCPHTRHVGKATTVPSPCSVAAVSTHQLAYLFSWVSMIPWPGPSVWEDHEILFFLPGRAWASFKRVVPLGSACPGERLSPLSVRSSAAGGGVQKHR